MYRQAVRPSLKGTPWDPQAVCVDASPCPPHLCFLHVFWLQGHLQVFITLKEALEGRPHFPSNLFPACASQIRRHGWLWDSHQP